MTDPAPYARPERRSAREIITLVCDSSTFTELPYPIVEFKADGPLSWQGYDASRARATARTGEEESAVCGTARIGGTPAVLIVFEFGFLGGSLGERTGDRLELAYEHARTHRLPVVALVATGGSRMQEGMLALTQLQRVARQSALTREAASRRSRSSGIRRPAAAGRPWARAPTSSSPCPAPRWASRVPGCGRPTRTRRRTRRRRRWRRARPTRSYVRRRSGRHWPAGSGC